ncbi:MAG: 16S rRNA (guanine(966)-N(2))-methyltransferase RsmD [Pseudomonadales bacterium]|nr:16S rRNA (guanine(966)-N(2))-methyltransferase RsmD [Pseudomonadales bacterium]
MTKKERTLRIIGGELRRRQVTFGTHPGIRPTPDRVRETLFNWLAPVLPGARCLELYAGSGILSMEALSRGARHVTLIEKDTKTCESLLGNLERLGVPAERFDVENAVVETFMARRSPGPFDIVFIDPPFSDHHVEPLLAQLGDRDWLADDAMIYVESPMALAAPPRFHVHRSGRAGQVHYCLLRRDT